jgi:hypothetical protein
MRVSRPSKLQSLVYEYESRRKLHTFLLTFGARILGRIATLGGTLGLFIKNILYEIMGKYSLFLFMFLGAAKPVV